MVRIPSNSGTSSHRGIFGNSTIATVCPAPPRNLIGVVGQWRRSSVAGHDELGPSGTGKTHPAIAYGLIAASKGCKVRFTSAADLVIALEAAHQQGRMKEITHGTVAMPKLLIIAEIGYLPFGRELAHRFFQIVAQR